MNTTVKSIDRRGTTLLEVFMVLLILTGTLSIIGIRSTFRSRTSVRQDSEEVVNAIRLARETAIISGCTVYVRHVRRNHPATKLSRDAIELLATPSPYRDLADDQDVGHFGAIPSQPSEWMTDPIWMNESTRIQSDSSEIKFNANGVASQDTKWVVEQSNDAVKISVEAVTGNILLGT